MTAPFMGRGEGSWGLLACGGSLRAGPGLPKSSSRGPGQRQASGHRNPRWQHQCSGRLEPRLNPGVLSSTPNTCCLGRYAHHQLWGVLTGLSPKGTSRGRQTPCPVPAPSTELGYSACRAGKHPWGPALCLSQLGTRGGRG